MSLQKRTLLVVTILVVCSTLGIYLVSRLTLLEGFLQIETNDTQENVLRTQKSYIEQSKNIIPSARGYAVWDDMYAFVQNPDPAFLEAIDLTPEIFATHQVNLISIVDKDGKLLYLEMFDLVTLNPLEIPSDLLLFLNKGSPILEFSNDKTEITGLILLNGKPMFIASLAALQTNFSGRPKGAVIFGRYLDEQVIANLSNTTNILTYAYLLDDTTMPSDVKHAHSKLSANKDLNIVYVNSIDKTKIAGYTYLTTLTNEPAFLLKIVLPRNIYAQGLTSLGYFTILTGFVGFLFLIIFILIIRHDVLKPLSRLTSQIVEIQESGDDSKRVKTKGKGELAQLGKSINYMLASLENRTKELELTNQELHAFSYSVSHDLHAPLRAINAYSELVLEEYSTSIPTEGKRYIQNILEGGKKLVHLIDRLLELSRLERNTLEKTQISPKEIINNILQYHITEIDLRQIRIEIEELPECYADSTLVSQVFTNLISNAFKYTTKNPNPRIVIGSFEDNHRTVYFIRDNGIGFDMLYADKLFKIFERLHTDTEFQGSGIGLSIVARIVSRHGGIIWAEAKVNEGACFYFTLQ
jgi:signal transduction histidine kinase